MKETIYQFERINEETIINKEKLAKLYEQNVINSEGELIEHED